MWGGWYNDPMLMDELAMMRGIVEDDLTKCSSELISEVVFFADETSYANLLSYSPHLGGITLTRTAMGNTGAPYDVSMVEDAEEILPRYKAAVFPFPSPSESGKRAMALCEALKIPYLTATNTRYTLTYEEIRRFLKDSGVHIYTNDYDVVYVGGGYLALHSKTGGRKTLKLPRPLYVTPIYGAVSTELAGDTLTFDLEDCATALFSLKEIKK